MTPDLIVGRYRVLRAVGKGGMGTVWLCEDELLGREVAVKQIGMLPGESAPDTARALREARSAAGLNHRNVVSVFDVVDDEHGHAWLVMEYVPSRTLGRLLHEEGRLSPERAARIAAQAADGLTAAHAAGTIHRDVKPGNILVGEGDLAKISDFGIARGATDGQLTSTGLVTGTPSYFSPELARGADPGKESDVYALGATLYTVVEGHPPYPEQRNPIAMLQQIAAAPPPPPQHAGPLAAPLAQMMARDPADRCSMAEAARLLHVVGHGHDPAPETLVLPASFAADAGTTAGPAFDPAPAAGPATTATPAPVAQDAGAPSATPVPGAQDTDGPSSTGAGPARGAAPTRGPVTDKRDSRSRRGLAWLAAAVLLLAVAGIGYLTLGDPGENDPQAAAEPTPSATRGEPSGEPAPSRTPEETPSGTAGQEATAEPEPEPEERSPDSPEPVEVVQEYFAAMPGNTDAGWARLAPSMQAQGRDAYEDWWSSIDAVELHSAEPVGDRQVEIALTYYFADGRATRESQLLTLERADDGYLIADDEVLSSRTVS